MNKAADGRRSARSNVVLTAMLEAGGQYFRVRVANVSAHGALVTGDKVPADGHQVTFRCNGRTIPSFVAWARVPYAGIQFVDEIQLRELLRAATVHSPMIIKDQRELDFRRPGFRGNQLTDEERKVVDEWTRG